MRNPYGIIRSWASNNDALKDSFENLDINRSRGLTRVWTEDKYPSVELLNSILSELYQALLEWQKHGILPFHGQTSNGYNEYSIVLDKNGIVRQGLIDNCEQLDPVDDVNQSCWSILAKSHPIASNTIAGLVRLQGAGTTTITRRQTAVLEDTPIVLSPAELQDAGLSSIAYPVDGVITDITLSGTTLTFTRQTGTESDTFSVDLNGLITNTAPINNPTFTGIVTVPTVAKASNTNVVASTGWVRRHLLSIIQSATRTQAGFFRFATRDELLNRPSNANSTAIHPAGLTYRLTLPYGTRGPRGDTGPDAIPTNLERGPQGDRGDRGDRGDPGRDVIGPKGFKGPIGPDTIGPRGEQGDRGPAATSAPQGPRGDPGRDVVGPRGAQGPRGPDVTGPKGEKGDRGPIGNRGPIGDRGDPGDPGDPGVKGDPGITTVQFN